MKRKIFSFLSAVLVATIICQFSGCSLIGLGIGAINDASKPAQANVPVCSIETAKKGAQIDIILKSGKRVSGKYLGLSPIPQEEYAKKYDTCQEENKKEISLPALGERIKLITKLGNQHECEFLGFDCGSIFVKSMRAARAEKVGFSYIKEIRDGQGNFIDPEKISSLMSEGKIALLSEIVIESREGRTINPTDDVSHVQIRVKKGG